MTDEQRKNLESIGKLVSEGKIDRRRLVPDRRGHGYFADRRLGGVAACQVTAAAAMAQDSDLKLVTVSEQQLATCIKELQSTRSG